MRLSDLLGRPGPSPSEPGKDIEIAGLTADSRTVQPGFLFAALPGTRQDGRKYIVDAVRAGAIAVLGPPDLRMETLATDVRLITDRNPRRQLAKMAARFYSAQPRTVAAVTGTNGKTSVAYFAQQFWNAAGRRAASLGTLGVHGANLCIPGSLTTPDPIELHRLLCSLKRQGIDHVAMEASSHGLEQFRLDGADIRAAAFTNLTRDHLDYHETMERYRAAKLRLFRELLATDGIAVLNAESPEYEALLGIAEDRRQRVISYGRHRGDLSCAEATAEPRGWHLNLQLFGSRYATDFPLPGAFQIANMLCALGLVVGCGEDPATVASHIAGLVGVPGRLETAARLDNGATVLVDYAHTPGALETVLHAVRPHVRGRLAVVFGCGGDRDRGKRPEMGAIAARHADSVIVTDDNPRSEDPAAIRMEILAACPEAHEVGGRREAIAVALDRLGPDDILIVAGKGHEEGQIVGDRVHPFNDVQVVRDLVGGVP